MCQILNQVCEWTVFRMLIDIFTSGYNRCFASFDGNDILVCVLFDQHNCNYATCLYGINYTPFNTRKSKNQLCVSNVVDLAER